MKKILCFLCLLLSMSFSLSVNAQEAVKPIDLQLDALFSHYNIDNKPGVSFAIMEKDKPTLFKSYGNANLEYQIKNTSNTLFNATDLAKQFTVFSILILQDEGKLSIHDDIKKYLPQFNQWPFRITLKHLMEQTSGLRDVLVLKNWVGYKNEDVITKQDILDLVAKQKHLNFPSGSKFEYNRTGFVLLTEVVEKVSGMSFSAFVDSNIFTPLEMNNSLFIDSHTELIPNRSYSYATTDNKFIKIANNSSFVGGTNLYTSTADFAKWLQNMSEQSIGRSAFYTYLLTKIKLPNGQTSNYTAGIFKEDSEGYWRIHLEGFDHGYTAYMLNIPEHDFSLIYFSNDVDFPHEDVKKIFWNWFNKDYSIPPVKSSVLPDVKFINKSKIELQNYIGSYLFEDNYSFRKIVLENDTLFYVRSETNRTPIVPIEGDHIFKMLYPNEDNLRVTFKDQGELLEFRVINPSEHTNDYVVLGKKLKPNTEKETNFSSEFKNETLNQTITLQNTKEQIQLLVGNNSIILDQIGNNEFLPQSNPTVNYVKLERDEQQNIVGVYLFSSQISNLYYELVNK